MSEPKHPSTLLGAFRFIVDGVGLVTPPTIERVPPDTTAVAHQQADGIALSSDPPPSPAEE